MRLQDIAKRTDAYQIDPRKIEIDPSYNVRIDGPELREANEQLKASIKVNGLGTPLRVRMDGDRVILVQGHRRLSQVMALINEGHDIQTVQALPELRGTSEQDRTLDLITSNSGHPLTMLEKAEVFKRLLSFGWDEARIAEKAGITTKQVGNVLTLGAAPEAVKELVSSGQVSATTAIQTVKKEGNSKAATTLTDAAASGKKVTAGSLKKATAPAANVSWLPPALQVQPEAAGWKPTDVTMPAAPEDTRKRPKNTPEKFKELVDVLYEVLELDDLKTIRSMVAETLDITLTKAA